MNRKHNPNLTPHAKELRKSMTEQERKLWHLFLKNYPVRFLRQKVIDRFVVDFYCASAKLIIELDGSQHFEEDVAIYDNARTDILKSHGLDVLRFTNKEVDINFADVCKKIKMTIKGRLK
jgi:very-short-patch-repair endonuclease